MAAILSRLFVWFQVEIYAAFLHDAVYLYAYALNKTLNVGKDSRDGKAIMKYIFNSTFLGKIDMLCRNIHTAQTDYFEST